MANKNKERQKSIGDIALEKLTPAGEAAWYFGFTEIKLPHSDKRDFTVAREFGEPISYGAKNHLLLDPILEATTFRTYAEHLMYTLPQPVMVCFKHPKGENKISEAVFDFHIIGFSRSIAEAVMIKTALAILADDGHKEMFVEVNSMGDRESANRFEKELVSHYRKHIENLPAEARQLFKHNIFEIPKYEEGDCEEFIASAPQSLSYLSDASREHFKEVLESLEVLGTPYKVQGGLIGSTHFVPQTLFSIRQGAITDKGSEVLAFGGRVTSFARRVGLKKEIPVVSMSVRIKTLSKISKPTKKMPRPKFYFMQLGLEAKLKALSVIDSLRKSKIPVSHSLTKDKIIGQMSSAENIHAPYLIIMGQKEAHENTVVVRHVATRAQETVAIAELPKYLKKLK